MDLDEIEIAAPGRDDELLAVHDALEQFAVHEAQKAELVKLRYFAGLSIAETAATLGISERTAKRHWIYARMVARRDVQTLRNNPSPGGPLRLGKCAW